MSLPHSHPCSDCGLYVPCEHPMESILEGRPVCGGYHDDPDHWRCPACQITARQIPANAQEIENARADMVSWLRPPQGYRRAEMVAGMLRDVAFVAQHPDTSLTNPAIAFAKAHGLAQTLRVVADALEAQ